jgi:hypothetical protein
VGEEEAVFFNFILFAHMYKAHICERTHL